MDGARLLADLDHLASIGADPAGGVSRVAYSAADIEARGWVRETMLALGMEVRRDEAVNLMGRYPGREGHLKPLALGSHTDTVPNGGRFDGALGVVGALACVRALHDAGVRLRHPVEVIDFAAEEATLGGGTVGSLAMMGRLPAGVLNRTAWDGRPAAAHLRDAGLDPRGLNRAVRPRRCLAGYLELHIEQGATLDAAGVPIGVVEGIVGIRRCAVTFAGLANHAGTTAMADRRDALVMAAPFVTGLRDVVVAAGIVGTVGVLRVQPGASNVIPGRVELEAEIRGLDEAVLDRVEAELTGLAERLGGELKRTSVKAPTRSHPTLVGALETACGALGLAWRRMPSGAGHDAMVIGESIPQAMAFVPSRGGVSHSPEEFTPPERCVDGARVLLRALLELDDLLDSREAAPDRL
ncbi:MAG TPA: M20 family metallo-hydrolase [Candidatus Eisenbacteria bacterium]|nr:M20 family metallo-hydrolase [Candidatus Eisenbacteria bacterium]